MRGQEFTPRCTCGRKIKFSTVTICDDRDILLEGYCYVCRQAIHSPITLAVRKRVFLELSAQREEDNLETDAKFLHDVGIRADGEV